MPFEHKANGAALSGLVERVFELMGSQRQLGPREQYDKQPRRGGF